MPSEFDLLILAAAFFFASLLYSSVGHGGASAYLAVMGLAGISQHLMKPTALVLNIFVSGLALILFCRAGYWKGRLFWPLAAASIPAAFLGGWMQASGSVFKWVLALALGFAAWRLAFAKPGRADESRELSRLGAAGLGGGLGFVSGLVGIGGGVFLTPMLILFRWAGAKSAAAVSAAFILVNSISGLLGFVAKGGEIPPLVIWLLPPVLAGGVLGSLWGSRKAPPLVLRRCLAAALAIAAIKFTVV